MPRTLTLEIDSDADPISGRVSSGGSSPHPFVGWLGLARALERALDEPRGEYSAER